jgi:hypothetical protein
LEQAEVEGEGDTYLEFWLLTDVFAFENIGFSKTVHETIKFLSCADCEVGPIGFQELNSDVGTNIYLCCTEDRIKYGD